jgi:proteasome lid subunit RPN8/RPN11
MGARDAYDAVLSEVAAMAGADPDREVCGFVVADREGVLAVVPVRNVAPEPRVAYEADPAAHLALARRLRAQGGRIAAVYHSHVHGPPRLSDEDLRNAVDEGRPILPGVDQIVAGLRDGKVMEVKVFTWTSGGFVEACAASGKAEAPDGVVAQRVAADAPGAKPQPT